MLIVETASRTPRASAARNDSGSVAAKIRLMRADTNAAGTAGEGVLEAVALRAVNVGAAEAEPVRVARALCEDTAEVVGRAFVGVTENEFTALTRADDVFDTVFDADTVVVLRKERVVVGVLLCSDIVDVAVSLAVLVALPETREASVARGERL